MKSRCRNSRSSSTSIIRHWGIGSRSELDLVHDFRSNRHSQKKEVKRAKTRRRQGKAGNSFFRFLGVLALGGDIDFFFCGWDCVGGTDAAVSPPPERRGNQPIANEITPEQQVAVEKGLEYLASRQNAEGSFGNSVAYGATAAITALSGIAFMADGNLPGRGKYGDNVRKAVRIYHPQSAGIRAVYHQRICRGKCIRMGLRRCSSGKCMG